MDYDDPGWENISPVPICQSATANSWSKEFVYVCFLTLETSLRHIGIVVNDDLPRFRNDFVQTKSVINSHRRLSVLAADSVIENRLDLFV